MKYILLLLSLVLTTHFSMAQGNRQTPKTTVPNKPSAEAKPKVKPTNGDLTIAEFLKTPKGLSLSAEQKADLGKIPPQTKLSELVDESSKQSNADKGSNGQASTAARYSYTAHYTLPSWACCMMVPPRACCTTTYDCPTLKLNKGAACNDNNPNTINDKVQNDCTCAGTVSSPPTVVNRVETANGLSIKIYLQEPANSTNRKGIVVVGSGNDQFAPTPGSLTGALENALCQKLANEGYIAAIVQYVVPAVTSNYSNWNAVGVDMATNYNKAFNGIITKYGGSRDRCIAGGVSFTTFLLLTNIAYYNDLADIKGFMGACGGTGTDQANNFKIPIASISCQNDYDAMYNINGEDLVNAITNPAIKSMSRGLRDQTCSGHCNGDTNTWVNWLTDSVKLWLP